MGREWEESSEIINAVRENICAADSRSAISRPSEHLLPTEKTGSSGIPSDVILMHDVSMLTSLPM